MRVLLAGASGAIGTPLTRQLIAAGHEVVGVLAEADEKIGGHLVAAEHPDGFPPRVAVLLQGHGRLAGHPPPAYIVIE